jgi:hypothetical protein
MSIRMLTAALGLFAAVACAPVDVSGGAQADPNPVLISLSRTACFGFCPDYTVTISGDGQVTYVGRNFESLGNIYRAPITDIPTQSIALTRNGHTKTVVDYGGTSVGMPPAVRELETEIDRVAGVSRWTLRDGQPVRTPTPQP